MKNSIKSDNIALLRWLQSEDRNGDYLEEPLPPIGYAIETIKEWVQELNAEVPTYITNIINRY